MSKVLEQLASDLQQLLDHRTIYLFSEIDEENSERVCRDLLRMSRDRQKITLCINSPGGHMEHGFAIVDMMNYCTRKGSYVHAIVLGYAASMAVAVLQAGYKRVVGENARLMLHQAVVTREDYMSQARDSLKDAEWYWNRYLALIAERSSLTVPQLDRRLLGRELYFTAEGALEVGLADAIL